MKIDSHASAYIFHNKQQQLIHLISFIIQIRNNLCTNYVLAHIQFNEYAENVKNIACRNTHRRIWKSNQFIRIEIIDFEFIFVNDFVTFIWFAMNRMFQKHNKYILYVFSTPIDLWKCVCIRIWILMENECVCLFLSKAANIT